MHYNLFKVQIIGNIGSVSTVGEGESAFTKISVACNGGYVDKKGEWQATTDWVEVPLSKKAKLENYKVGRSVLVEGVPRPIAYLDKKGEPVAKLAIVAGRVIFQDAKPGTSEVGGEPTAETVDA